MTSQISGVDRSRFPGRGTVREVRKGGRRASDRAKKRIYRFRLLFKYTAIPQSWPWRWQAKHVEKRRCKPSDLHHFCKSSESLASFTNRVFHFSRPPCFRMAFDAAERNGRFGRIQSQTGKESSCRGKRRVFFCGRTVRVKVESKVIPASFQKIDGRGRSFGRKSGERGTDRRIGK